MVTGESEIPTVRGIYSRKIRDSSLSGSDCCLLSFCLYLKAVSDFPDGSDGKGGVWSCLI